MSIRQTSADACPPRGILRSLRALGGDQRGAVAIYFGFGLLIFCASVGLAVDAARGYLLKARLSQALDAAALAGGKALLDPTNFENDINMYFKANLPPGAMDSTVAPLTIVTDPDKTTVTITATATMPTTIMNLMGFDHMDVSAKSQVTRGIVGLDVVLAIDVSGSMADPTPGFASKIAAARTAAKEMTKILFDPFRADPNLLCPTIQSVKYCLLNIGLVPWNAKVNVSRVTVAGSTATTVAYNNTGTVGAAITHPVWQAASTMFTANNSEVPLLSKPASNWKGCVYARYIDDNDNNDDADMTLGAVTVGGKQWLGWEPIPTADGEDTPGNWPSSTAGDPAYQARYNMGGKVGSGAGSKDSENKTWNNYSGVAKSCNAAYWNDTFHDPKNRPGGFGVDPGPVGAPGARAGVPAPPAGTWVFANPSSDTDATPADCSACANRGIFALQTATGAGAKVGLDRETEINGVIDSLSAGGYTDAVQGLFWGWEVLMPGAPFDQGVVATPFPRTQAIILMTDGQTTGNNGDAYKGVFGLDNIAATNTLHGNLPDGNFNNLNNRLLALAKKIKGANPEKGTKIYVIQYQEADPNLKDLLKQVATEPGEPYYYFAAEGTDLSGIFKKIARDLSRLRVSQ